MVKKLLSIVIALILLSGLCAISALAAEAPSSWAVDEVNRAVLMNLVPQSLQSKYSQPITRAEFCALAAALYETATGTTITERVKFSDTSDVNVEKMAAVEVVNGTSPGIFTPNAQLTREQAATMLARLASAIGKPLPMKAAAFNDNSSISSWAIAAVGQVQAAGIMNGTSAEMFSPGGSYTREQSIATIWRSFTVVKGGAAQSPYSGGYFGAPQGSAKILGGNALLVTIFISCDGSVWSDQDISMLRGKLSIVKDFIEAQSDKYNSSLNLICDFANNPDLRYDMQFSGELYDFDGNYSSYDKLSYDNTNLAIHNFIEENVPYLSLAEKYHTDSIGYILFANKTGWNYSNNYRTGNQVVWYHDKAILFGAALGPPSYVAHEILHMFGAVDLYYANAFYGVSDALVSYVKSNYPNDLMMRTLDINGDPVWDGITNEISPITAYCLGWVDDIPELRQFPELRRTIPAALIDQSR